MSESAALEAVLKLIDAAPSIPALIATIDAALAVKAPAGDPDTIAAQADTYGRVAHECQAVVDDELAVKTKSLPASWHGQAAESATQALDLLILQAGGAQEAFAAAAKALTTWADQLRTAQSQDTHGRAQLVLERARAEVLEQYELFELNPDLSIVPAIREAAASGCHDRWAAANLVASAADDASAALSPWPEQARAQQIHVPGVDALTAVTLAYYGGGSVLTPTAEMLASKHLDAMSQADLKAFEKLMAEAKSPTEAEYLFKAASVGQVGHPDRPAYSLGQLESFDAVIHRHGTDPAWLRQHLDPGIARPPRVSNFASQGISMSFDNSGMPTFLTQTNAAPGKTNTFLGQKAAALNQELKDANQALTQSRNAPRYISPAFAQDQEPYCVSDSAVMARLAADPVLMLGVTTGQGPAAVSASGVRAGDDSPAAVAARAQSLFNQNYAYARAVEGDDPKTFLGITYQAAAPPGLDPSKGGIAVDDQLLTPVTGTTYHYQPLIDRTDFRNDAALRQAALPKIEAAVQAGEPVPIGVLGPSSPNGHTMVIEGYQNGELEVYNPWGFSESVSTTEFVDGQLGALTDKDVGGPPGGYWFPTDVELPQQ